MGRNLKLGWSEAVLGIQASRSPEICSKSSNKKKKGQKVNNSILRSNRARS
jgi:hypothetical protein